MLVHCCHCEEETNQILVQVNASKFGHEFLLTTYRCHQCWQYTYGMCDRAKWDTKSYPYLEETEPRNNTKFFDSNDLNDYIKYNSNNVKKDDSSDFIEDDVFPDDCIEDVVNYYKIEAEHDSIKDELDACYKKMKKEAREVRRKTI